MTVSYFDRTSFAAVAIWKLIIKAGFKVSEVSEVSRFQGCKVSRFQGFKVEGKDKGKGKGKGKDNTS
jgi:hypothetical protein